MKESVKWRRGEGELNCTKTHRKKQQVLEQLNVPHNLSLRQESNNNQASLNHVGKKKIDVEQVVLGAQVLEYNKRNTSLYFFFYGSARC